jgi:hypothetical protein
MKKAPTRTPEQERARYAKRKTNATHLTGMHRGHLCFSCNLALGLVGDAPDGVRKLLTYIERAYARIREGFKS